MRRWLHAGAAASSDDGQVAPTVPDLATWLDRVHVGYARLEPLFAAAGYESVDDLRLAPGLVIRQLPAMFKPVGDVAKVRLDRKA